MSRPVMAPADWLATLAAKARRLRDEAAARDAGLAGPPPAEVVAIGLATVDLDRATAESPATAWAPLPRDSLLGAIVRRLDLGASQAGIPPVLLLEPDTEGLLAAALARLGEGLAAVYLRSPRPPALDARAAVAGPLGPARLLPGPRWGPHVVVVDGLEPGATIER